MACDSHMRVWHTQQGGTRQTRAGRHLAVLHPSQVLNGTRDAYSNVQLLKEVINKNSILSDVEYYSETEDFQLSVL